MDNMPKKPAQQETVFSHEPEESEKIARKKKKISESKSEVKKSNLIRGPGQSNKSLNSVPPRSIKMF